MNYIIFLLLSISINNAHGVSLKIFDGCSDSPVFEIEKSGFLNLSLGSVSVKIFSEYDIPFQGTEAGLNSLVNSPIGLEALEIISDERMRAYGWCYSLNEESPELLSNQVFIEKQSDKIVWFFAFSEYDKGEWISQCVPAITIKPGYICRK